MYSIEAFEKKRLTINLATTKLSFLCIVAEQDQIPISVHRQWALSTPSDMSSVSCGVGKMSACSSTEKLKKVECSMIIIP